MEKLLNRINELARKAKTADGLTETEKLSKRNYVNSISALSAVLLTTFF